MIHPKCQIIAEGGDITFGDHCIIEEKVRIINRARKDEQGRPVRKDMTIGSYNFFEVHSQLDSTDVGDMNEFQFKCMVQDGCKIDNFCQINACVTVPRGTHLPNYSVVYEDGGRIRENLDFNEDAKRSTVKELCTFLLEQLPKHNKQRE